MIETIRDLEREYAEALREFLGGAGEPPLQRAYELGRRALAAGLGVLDIVTLHHMALVKVLPSSLPSDTSGRMIRAAADFFIQAMSPFEMTHRGFKESYAELQASEERYRELFENANDIVFTTDLEGNFTSVNRAGEQLTGYPRADTPKMKIDQIVPPEHQGLVRRILEPSIDGGGPTTYELEIIAKDGRRVPVEVSTRLIFQDGRPVGVQGIARDISERKQAEEALRHLNETLEEEVKRIAHALHDEAGQLLAAVYLAVGEIASDVKPSGREGLAQIHQLLDQIDEQVRRLAHELRPTILDELGLLPALEFLAEGVSKRNGLSISVEGSTEGRLPPSIEVAFYRIFQEALTNVTKHAQATQASIRVQQNTKEVGCVIRDDGIGFDVSVISARKGSRGLGLIGIRERLEALGGRLVINSAPGRGTALEITIPL